MELIHTFEFAAAHQLPKVPPGHKCGRMHGHTYTVELHLSGTLDLEMGWVVDFAAVKDAWAPLHDQLDHRSLNDVLPNPTAENLAIWIAGKLGTQLQAELDKVVVWETPHSAAAITRPKQQPGQESLYD